MSGSPLSLEEARGLVVPPDVFRILAPEEVAEHAVVPLALEGDVLTLAADPAASDKIDLLLRMDHGFRQVIVRRTSRAVVDHLLETHFRPFWDEKGWTFSGLPRDPGGGLDPESAPSAAVEPEAPAVIDELGEPGAEAARAHPVVLAVEAATERRQAISALLTPAGYEVRFAATREDVEREVRISPPALVTVRRDGPVPPEEIIPIVRGSGGKTEFRVVADPVQAVLGGDAGDDRFPRFLFDLTRFFVGLTAMAGGGRMDVTEARVRYAEGAARGLGLGAADTEATRLAALLGDLDGHLARFRGEEASTEGRPAEGVLGPLLDPERTPYAIGEVLEARAERFDGSGPRGLRGDAIPIGARVLAAVDEYLRLRNVCSDPVEVDGRLREASGAALDAGAVEAVLRADRAARLVDRLGCEEARERVLLVEPDPAAASLLEMRLANAGFDVDVHRNGPAALDAATASPPVLVLSEVTVPGMDGFTLLLRLRNTSATAEVPFVFVSARTDRGSTMRGFELGADDFIAKPADLELLVAKVKGLVRKSRGRRPEVSVATSGIAGACLSG